MTKDWVGPGHDSDVFQLEVGLITVLLITLSRRRYSSDGGACVAYTGAPGLRRPGRSEAAGHLVTWFPVGRTDENPVRHIADSWLLRLLGESESAHESGAAATASVQVCQGSRIADFMTKP